MFAIIGIVIVFGAIVAGYLMEKGQLAVLIQPAELIIIGGAALGTLLIANPLHIIKGIISALTGVLGGSKFNKARYLSTLKMMYQFLNKVRKEGLLSVENDVEKPQESSIFKNYPDFLKDHHSCDFVCDTLRMAITGGVEPFDMDQMMELDMEVSHHESTQPISALSTVADALPGLGIVAAVLGIVITMGAIDGPVEEIGHKVGAALVGTFLGILLSYGFFAPLVVKMEFIGAAESAYFRTLAGILQGFADQTPPKVAIEMARRGLNSEVRPGQQRVEEMLKALDTAA